LTTSLGEDELLTEIEFRIPSGYNGQAFVEFARRHGDFALGGAAVLVTLDADGWCTEARIGMLAAGGTPVRARAAEAVVAGNRVNDMLAREAAEEAVRDLTPPQDVHGSAEFRRRVNREVVRRALLAAAARARERLH
jgi:carbon-monoxide dehydrogenase medium subunit/6-hydroxypseudooxynicotine dehydrogenase subunit alpha